MIAGAPRPRARADVAPAQHLSHMSRAFVNEDAGNDAPPPRYDLPPRADPSFDAAAARALLEGARAGDTISAEDATGYRWGEPRLREHVQAMLDRAVAERDERAEQLARRYLKQLRTRPA